MSCSTVHLLTSVRGTDPQTLRLRGPPWRSGVQTTANSEHDNREKKLNLDPRKTCKGLVENRYFTQEKMSETSS